MNERQLNILKAIINEYQKTGQPVASQVLAENYDFELSPATVRAEMLALDGEGFLVQPYHSAGRVPTTKAYRLFVDELLKERKFDIRDREQLRKKISRIDERTAFSNEVAKFLADFSHNLGLSGTTGELIDFHEAGFSWFCDSFEEPQNLIDILKGFDTFEKQFNKFFEEPDEVEVFIGEENPIDGLKLCSLLLAGYEFENTRGFLGILGPKRMDYAKNIFLVEETKKLLKEKN